MWSDGIIMTDKYMIIPREREREKERAFCPRRRSDKD